MVKNIFYSRGTKRDHVIALAKPFRERAMLVSGKNFANVIENQQVSSLHEQLSWIIFSKILTSKAFAHLQVNVLKSIPNLMNYYVMRWRKMTSFVMNHHERNIEKRYLQMESMIVVISKSILVIQIDHVTNSKWFPIQMIVCFQFMLGQIGVNALQLVVKQLGVVIWFVSQRARQLVRPF